MFTTTSTVPYVSTVFATTSFTRSRLDESQDMAKPSPPASLISFTVASIGSILRPVHTTLTPRFARQSAMPFPIPWPAPVTIATFSFNCFIIVFLSIFLKILCKLIISSHTVKSM